MQPLHPEHHMKCSGTSPFLDDSEMNVNESKAEINESILYF